MVGIVVVTHGRLAEELISVVRFVMSENPAVKIEGLSLDQSKEFETFTHEIKKAIKKVDEELASQAPMLKTKPVIKYEIIMPEKYASKSESQEKKSLWERLFG